MIRTTLRTLVLTGLAAIAANGISANGIRITFAESHRIMPASLKAFEGVAEDYRTDRQMRGLATLESLLLARRTTVGVDFNTVREDADKYVEAVRMGIAVWDHAITASPFREALPNEKPDVLIRFVDAIRDGDDVQGKVTVQHRYSWAKKSYSYETTATMLIRRNTGRRMLRQDEISEVVAHELGHLLGLDDSDDSAGLMGPFVPGSVRLEPSHGELTAVLNFRDALRASIGDLRRRANLN